MKGYRDGDPIGLVTSASNRRDLRCKCKFCDWTKDGTHRELLGRELRKHFNEEHR